MKVHIFNEAPERPADVRSHIGCKTMCGKIVDEEALAGPVLECTCVFCKDELVRRIQALDLACPPTPLGQEYIYHQQQRLKRYLSID